MKKNPEPKYVIGIDLGTTNSALAYAELRPVTDPFDLPKVELLSIPQLVNPAEVREDGLLPDHARYGSGERIGVEAICGRGGGNTRRGFSSGSRSWSRGDPGRQAIRGAACDSGSERSQ